MTGKKKQMIHQPVIINLLITVMIYPFMETLLSNKKEFAFQTGSTTVYAAGSVLIMYGILILLGFLFRYHMLYAVALFVFSIAAYIQQMLLNGQLFLMDGGKNRWGIGLKLSNIVIWFLIFAIIFLLWRCFGEKMMHAVKWTACALTLMQLACIISLVVSNAGDKAIKSKTTTDYFSTDGIYKAASDENIMIFVLDTYDIDYLHEVLQEHPDFLEPLKGFTYFPDTVSQFSRTFPSIPYMLTNELYFYEKPYVEYCDEAYIKCDFWDKVHNNGYELYFYEESSEYVGSSLRRKASNYVAEGHVIDTKISLAGVFEAMCRIGGYRGDRIC